MRSVRRRRRAAFAHRLRGVGLEIGALTDPLPIPNADRVVYSDWLSAEHLDALHPGSRKPDIISDSQSFPTVANETFDFVVANHVLEHLTDPVGALIEWHRILKCRGLLMLTLPDKRFTFDAPRSRTALQHLIEDHQSSEPPGLRNRAHLEEWATHVERFQPGTPEREQWIEGQLKSGYTVHNHVWVPLDIVNLIAWLNETTAATWCVDRMANTSPFTNEFMFLLRRDDLRPSDRLRIARFRRRLRLTDPIVDILGMTKLRLRGSSKSRFAPEA